MDVAWLTARKIDKDLCATTQLALANGLVEMGINLVMYSPSNISASSFQHVQVNRSSIMGLQSSSIVNNLKKHLENIENSDCVIIDWKLSKIAKHIESKCIIIDRGPPADKGIFSYLQWPAWSRAWRNSSFGCVVSGPHGDFVKKKIPEFNGRLKILPAGVDTTVFFPREKNDNKIKLVYHGRLDEHRGLPMVLELARLLDTQSDKFEFHFHGEGKYKEVLISSKIPNVHVTGNLDQIDLAKRLGGYDIGLLPMPDQRIWRIASPLKRSEYLASGLVVLGIDHQGNSFEKNHSFMKLFSQERFLNQSIDWLMNIDLPNFRKLQTECKIFAERELQWRVSIQNLYDLILEITS